MAILMSSVCFASLSSYAYGPPEYKEGILLSDDEDNLQQPNIAVAVPCVLTTKKKILFPSPKTIGVFRCVSKRSHPSLSINDYMRFPPISRFFFCLVEFTSTDVSIRVFRVNYKSYIYSLEPIEFDLFPKSPNSEENLNKDGLVKSFSNQSHKSLLEEIKACNAQLFCQMEKVYAAARDPH
ncbi:hypothetical protein ECG_00310 [Echinococcus granulosus]|uniref:Expressed conserved protein n=1 Tax=Echinococcus granulosus TaxID=6210 RepID=A0A068WXX9_ECHGR|nr:hypothetical protein ECG_00310 [Echinococcus granulosus]CDS22535.1 expressed conserved protein [Echinococcus granulosus]